MIASKYRFHGHNSLRYAYQRGQTVRGELFTLRVAPNPKRDVYRAAIVVSRKISKSAVKRNRMRRRLYEIIRQAAPDFVAPFDIVFIVSSDKVLDTPTPQLTRELTGQLAKAGVVSVKK